MKFPFFGGKSNDDVTKEKDPPFSFELENDYCYPDLYDEADAMLQVSMLIYTITDLRILAKKKKTKLKTPERILTLPLRLETCFEMIRENLENIQQEFNDEDHAMTMSALQSIQQRFYARTLSSPPSSNTWLNSFVSTNDGRSRSEELSPIIVAYGDVNPDSELVYAVGVDAAHKRVTVAFRGSVTANDFVKDVSIALNQQPNPVKDA